MTRRFDADGDASRAAYEDGMFRVFRNCLDLLREDGRLVVVFANKQPAAWETLVSALIRAGFVVNGSWPIRTEMQNKVAGGAASRPRSGWSAGSARRRRGRGGTERCWRRWRLRSRRGCAASGAPGVRGPDFVWAATGPALEAFSRHPVVKKADAPGERLTVSEFLRRVRRMVVGFVVSRLLDQRDGAAGELDDPTTCYLLHRSDFGLAAAPAGACILYALSCNLSDADLAGRFDLLARGGRTDGADGDAEREADAGRAGDEAGAAARNGGDANGGGVAETGAAGRAVGGEVCLKPWRRRRARDLGEPVADGGPPPLIDCLHRLMQLWRTGEQRRVDAYLETRGLWRHELFARVTQEIVELAERGSEERALLESIQNHLRTGGGAAPASTLSLDFGGGS